MCMCRYVCLSLVLLNTHKPLNVAKSNLSRLYVRDLLCCSADFSQLNCATFNFLCFVLPELQILTFKLDCCHYHHVNMQIRCINQKTRASLVEITVAKWKTVAK